MSVAPFVDTERADGLAAELEHATDACTRADLEQREQEQCQVLRSGARRQRSGDLDAQHLRSTELDGAGHERIGHVGRPDANRDATELAAV